jgi:hypothetical protein
MWRTEVKPALDAFNTDTVRKKTRARRKCAQPPPPPAPQPPQPLSLSGPLCRPTGSPHFLLTPMATIARCGCLAEPRRVSLCTPRALPFRALQPRPGLQAFHCLTADPNGGDTILTDGFAVAATLRARHPETFTFFSTLELPFHHTGADGLMTQWQRVIELGDDGETVTGFGYNNDDRAPLALRRCGGGGCKEGIAARAQSV